MNKFDWWNGGVVEYKNIYIVNIYVCIYIYKIQLANSFFKIVIKFIHKKWQVNYNNVSWVLNN